MPEWLLPQWQRLQEASKNDRAGHAILFSGPKGVGKHRLAAELIRLALCDQSDDVACGSCRSCTCWQRLGNHPDYHSLVVPEDKSTIGVDQVRALVDRLSLSPTYQNRKVGIIRPAESMTQAAANALLKTLEEPPGDTLLILVSHQAWRLPATIISRCQTVSCGVPKPAEARRWLNEFSGEAGWEVSLELAGGAPLQAIIYKKQNVESLFEEIIDDLIGFRWQSRPGERGRGLGRRASRVRLTGLYKVLRQLVLKRLGLEGELAHKSGFEVLHNALQDIKLSAMLGYQDKVLRTQTRLAGPLNQQLLLEELLAPWTDGFKTANWSNWT